MTDTTTPGTDLAAFQQGDLAPADARQLAAHWREAQRLAVTSVIPKSITHKRQRIGDRWQDVAQPAEVVKATVFAVVRFGAAFGFAPAVALGKIDVVEGRLEPRYDALNALMQDAGHQVRIAESSTEIATVRVRRAEDRNDPDGWQQVSFTLREAIDAGYVKITPEERDRKAAWTSRRADMLMSKAIKRACRWITPDVLLDRQDDHLIEGADVEQMLSPARAAGVIDAAATVSSPAASSQRQEGGATQTAPQPAGDEHHQHNGDDDIVDATIVDDEAAHAAHDHAEDGMRTPGSAVESTAEVPGGDAAPADPPGQPAITDPQRRKLMALLSEKRNATTRPERIDTLSELVGRRVESTNDLTVAEASRVIDHLEGEDPWGEP